MSPATVPHLVVTSINPPTPILQALADGAQKAGWRFIVIGDRKSPPDFALSGCDYYDPARQEKLEFAFAQRCPWRHYARKNIGYLLAIQQGAPLIVETDDDNWPRPDFYGPRQLDQQARQLAQPGWVNVYRYFHNVLVWPRGLPLDAVTAPAPADLPLAPCMAPIQQGLADDNPDVDAIYRLLLPLPVQFAEGAPLALAAGCWSPFNSQNTSWWPVAYPLLYLPATCSFRMTDIWRSFVAQRIGWENGWSLLFHRATVWQERNDHNLMKDFADEVPGYLHNRSIGQLLSDLPLRAGAAAIPDNLRACYAALRAAGHVTAEELPLLEAWLADITRLMA